MRTPAELRSDAISVLAVSRAVRAHPAFLPVVTELARVHSLPLSERQTLWTAYRRARRAMRAPDHSQQLGITLAALVLAGRAYAPVAHGLRLARAATLAQLRAQGAHGRVQRGLAHEAFHLARLSFRAALGLREEQTDPQLHFGQAPCRYDWQAFSDGSYRAGRAAAGVLLQQTDGDALAELSLTLTSACALEAELAAALLALQTLSVLGARRILLHVDSLGVLRAFEQRLALKYCVQEAELQDLVRQFDALTVALVPRLHNHAADRLAARSGSLQKC